MGLLTKTWLSGVLGAAGGDSAEQPADHAQADPVVTDSISSSGQSAFVSEAGKALEPGDEVDATLLVPGDEVTLVTYSEAEITGWMMPQDDIALVTLYLPTGAEVTLAKRKISEARVPAPLKARLEKMAERSGDDDHFYGAYAGGAGGRSAPRSMSQIKSAATSFRPDLLSDSDLDTLHTNLQMRVETFIAGANAAELDKWAPKMVATARELKRRDQLGDSVVRWLEQQPDGGPALEQINFGYPDIEILQGFLADARDSLRYERMHEGRSGDDDHFYGAYAGGAGGRGSANTPAQQKSAAMDHPHQTTEKDRRATEAKNRLVAGPTGTGRFAKPEGRTSLGAGQPVAWSGGSEAGWFAQKYVDANKWQNQSNPSRAMMERGDAAQTFLHDNFTRTTVRQGFAGSGTDRYTHPGTGMAFEVARHATGENFFSTAHQISQVAKGDFGGMRTHAAAQDFWTRFAKSEVKEAAERPKRRRPPGARKFQVGEEVKLKLRGGGANSFKAKIVEMDDHKLVFNVNGYDRTVPWYFVVSMREVELRERSNDDDHFYGAYSGGSGGRGSAGSPAQQKSAGKGIKVGGQIEPGDAAYRPGLTAQRAKLKNTNTSSGNMRQKRDADHGQGKHKVFEPDCFGCNIDLESKLKKEVASLDMLTRAEVVNSKYLDDVMKRNPEATNMGLVDLADLYPIEVVTAMRKLGIARRRIQESQADDDHFFGAWQGGGQGAGGGWQVGSGGRAAPKSTAQVKSAKPKLGAELSKFQKGVTATNPGVKRTTVGSSGRTLDKMDKAMAAKAESAKPRWVSDMNDMSPDQRTAAIKGALPKGWEVKRADAALEVWKPVDKKGTLERVGTIVPSDDNWDAARTNRGRALELQKGAGGLGSSRQAFTLDKVAEFFHEARGSDDDHFYGSYAGGGAGKGGGRAAPASAAQAKSAAKTLGGPGNLKTFKKNDIVRIESDNGFLYVGKIGSNPASDQIIALHQARRSSSGDKFVGPVTDLPRGSVKVIRKATEEEAIAYSQKTLAWNGVPAHLTKSVKLGKPPPGMMQLGDIVLSERSSDDDHPYGAVNSGGAGGRGAARSTAEKKAASKAAALSADQAKYAKNLQMQFGYPKAEAERLAKRSMSPLNTPLRKAVLDQHNPAKAKAAKVAVKAAAKTTAKQPTRRLVSDLSVEEAKTHLTKIGNEGIENEKAAFNGGYKITNVDLGDLKNGIDDAVKYKSDSVTIKLDMEESWPLPKAKLVYALRRQAGEKSAEEGAADFWKKGFTN